MEGLAGGLLVVHGLTAGLVTATGVCPPRLMVPHTGTWAEAGGLGPSIGVGLTLTTGVGGVALPTFPQTEGGLVDLVAVLVAGAGTGLVAGCLFAVATGVVATDLVTGVPIALPFAGVGTALVAALLTGSSSESKGSVLYIPQTSLTKRSSKHPRN